MGISSAIDGLPAWVVRRVLADGHFAVPTPAAAERAAQALHLVWPGVRIWLFGSVAQGTARPGSDLDLAICGLPTRDMDRAWVIATDAIASDHLDLIHLDECSESLRVRVLCEGRPL